MEILKKSIFPTIFLFVFLLTTGCQKKYNSELVPFFDGMYLKYKVITNSGSHEEIFSIKEENSEYKIFKEDVYKSHILEEIVTHVVDCYGVIKEKPVRTMKTSKRTKILDKLKGRRICIWIPPDEMQVGKKLETSLGNFRIIEEATWEKWNVWVLKDGHGNKSFYDRETGFYVGIQSISGGLIGSMKTILIDTNADIPY